MELQLYEMESPRLRFRRLRANDYALVSPILQDEQTMHAWGHRFTYDEVCDWIADMLQRYHESGFGYFAGFHRQTGELIALAGPLVERLSKSETAIGLGYIVRRDCWRQGYGKECAQAALHYAFHILSAERVVALIRPDNIASLHVAAACGMKPIDTMVKHYQGEKIPHLVCAVSRPAPPEA